MAPPLLIAAGVTYFDFSLTNAPETVLTANSAVATGTSLILASAGPASQIGALPGSSAMRLASLEGLRSSTHHHQSRSGRLRWCR
jgi:hypothetical protein